jgi:NDP-sugar pyrophosphorylase family protein
LPLLVDEQVRIANREPQVANREPRTTNRESRTANRDTFLIVNGDTLTDVRIAPIVAAHVSSGAAVTMALIPNPSPDKYGGVQVADGRWVTGFTRAGSGGPSYHFIGVQIVDARVFAELDDGVPAETVNGLYPRMMVADGNRSTVTHRRHRLDRALSCVG